MPAIIISKRQSWLKNVIRGGVSSITKPFWSVLPRFLYLGKSPQVLNLALTRLCNINCVFCPYQFIKKGDKIHMSDQLFKKVLHDIKNSKVSEVRLSPNVGEPLLAPNFIKKVKALREFGVEKIQLTTNATLLHRIGIEAILKDGPDNINISFPGFIKEMYERICRAPFYNQTRSNILKLLRKNASTGNSKKISFRLRGDIPIDKILELPLMDEVIELANEIEVMTEVDDWIGLIGPEMLSQGFKIQKEKPLLTIRPCAKLFDLTIHPDGDIHLCGCRNVFLDPRLHIGNVQEMSITEAFSKIPDILAKWESGEFPIICKRCSMYNDPTYYILGRFRRIVHRRVFSAFNSDYS